MGDIKKNVLKAHKEWKGKIEIISRVEIKDQEDLSLAYTPGVAEPCKEIYKNKDMLYEYCRKGNLVAVVTDGSAVLGLGNIGPEAAMPVMEGKCILFKTFADIDAFPICLDTQDVNKIVDSIEYISPTFGGINLEDISAPRCFEIEKMLKQRLDIPVFHDDQHGTAIVVLAALSNALKLTKKKLADVSVVVNGSGSAGIAITKLLLSVGFKEILLCDRKGIIHKNREELNSKKQEMAEVTNPFNKRGDLSNAIVETDVFIGVSGPGVLTKKMITSMNKEPIIFAMANPDPEIDPLTAKEAGAKIIGTGRSDYPNQINNVLAFPGIFRGALDVRASDINEEMKLAAAYAIASLVSDIELDADFIIPSPFDERVAPTVAKAVGEAARKSGVGRI